MIRETAGSTMKIRRSVARPSGLTTSHSTLTAKIIMVKYLEIVKETPLDPKPKDSKIRQKPMQNKII